MSSTTDGLAQAAVDFTEALRATTSDPVDAIRLITSFLAALPAPEATAALFRRAALASIAMACADYEPASSTEAAATLDRVATLFDNEITAAADAGEFASYTALRTLRAAVVADLTARSAPLPELVTVALPAPMPSLALAYRLYGDAAREPGMVDRAGGVVHPGFMPRRFEALAT